MIPPFPHGRNNEQAAGIGVDGIWTLRTFSDNDFTVVMSEH